MFIEYYNILTNGAPGGSIFLSITFTLIVSTLVYFRFRKTMVKLVKFIPILLLLSVIGITINKSISNREYNRLKSALLNKKHSIVEGVVTDFNSNENSDSFSINNIKFIINDNRSDGAFHDLSKFGGPLKEGLYIRVFYYEDKIIALWIKE